MNGYDQLPTLADLQKPLTPSAGGYESLPSLDDLTLPPGTSVIAPKKEPKPKRALPAPLAPQEEKPKSEPIGNVAGNFMRDIRDIAGGIAELFTTGLWKGMKQLATNPSQHWEDIKTLYGEEGRKQIADALIGRYVKAWKDGGVVGLGEEALRHPGLTLLDLSAAATGIGAVGKFAGKGGQIAANVGRMGGPLTQGATRLSQASGALVKGSQALSRTGQVIDPLMNAGKLAGKLGKPVLEALGVGPESATLSKLKDMELSAEMHKNAEDFKRLYANTLSPSEKVALDKVISVNARGSLAQQFPTLAEESLSPAAKRAFEIWKEIQGAQEFAFKERPGFLSKTRADKANAKRALIYLKEHGVDTDLDEVLKMMERGDIDPTFASMFSELDGESGMLQSFLDDLREGFSGTARKVARLEERAARGDFIRDPAIYMARQTKMFHDLNWRLRWMDRSIQHLKGKNLIRAVRSAKDVPDGYEVIPETIYRRYIDTNARAGSVIVDAIQRQLASTGQISPEAIAAALNQFIDGEVAKGIGKVNTIAVPRHVARHIARELGIPGPWGRIYDRTLGVWKSMATVMNPKYWVPVAVSNAFLGVIRGLGVRDFRNWRKFREFVPAALRARSEVGLELPGVSKFERVAGNAGEYAQMLDREFLRGPIYTQEVMNAFKELKATGDAFFDAKLTADEFLMKVAQSTDLLSDIERKVELLQNQIASRVPELQAAKVKLKKLDALLPKLKATMDRAQVRVAGAKPKQAQLIQARRRYVQAREMHGRLSIDIANQESKILQRLQSSGELLRQIPELRPFAEVSERALVEGNRWTGNYQRLHPILRVQFRRGVPFWNYLSTMLKLAFRMPYLYPARTFMWNRFANLVNEAVTDDEQPEWVQRFVPFAAASDGGMWAINLASANPWTGSKMGELGGGAFPQALDIAQQNPIVKLAFDLYGNTPRWSQRPISPGERATRLDNGAAIQLGHDGTLRKTIPQLGVMRAVWNMNPLSQLIDNLLLGQAQSDRGWLLEPDPLLDRAGKPLDDKGLVERIVPLFVRIQKIDIGAEKAKERRRIMTTLRSFKDDIRRLPPDKRTAVMEAVRDRLQDEDRRWEAIQD